MTSAAVAAATTPLVSPLAITAQVTPDFAAMALVVRRPKDTAGYAAFLWRESHQALVKAEESGWPPDTRFVWGSAPGNYQFGHARPGENLTLRFTFQPGTSAAQVYAELVSKPGLYAIVTADKSARVFLGVTFRHSP